VNDSCRLGCIDEEVVNDKVCIERNELTGRKQYFSNGQLSRSFKIWGTQLPFSHRSYHIPKTLRSCNS